MRKYEHRDAEQRRARCAASTMPGDLGRRRHLAEVVDACRPTHDHDGGEHHAERLGDCRSNIGVEGVRSRQATAMPTRKPTNMADAAERAASGAVCTRRSSGSTTAPTPDGQPAHQRAWRRTWSTADDRADDRVGRRALGTVGRRRASARVGRELGAERRDVVAHRRQLGVVVAAAQRPGDERGDLAPSPARSCPGW